MELKKFKDILYKYLNKQASKAERVLVEFWYQSYDDKPSALTEKIKEDAKRSMWLQISSQAGLSLPVRRLNFYRIGIAAALLVFLSVMIFHLSSDKEPSKTNGYTSIATTTGQIKYVVLPDSSGIYLNANTRIRFKDDFNAVNREVFLDAGEAYFEVTHHADRPFIVHTGQMNTRVLGTSFNITAYRELKRYEVLVNTGKVQVNYKGKEMALLTRDQKIGVDIRTGASGLSTASAKQYLTWTKKEINLKNASFAELKLLIYNHYGFELKTTDTAIEKYTFSIPLNLDTPIHTLMQQISRIHQNQFTIKGKEITMR